MPGRADRARAAGSQPPGLHMAGSGASVVTLAACLPLPQEPTPLTATPVSWVAWAAAHTSLHFLPQPCPGLSPAPATGRPTPPGAVGSAGRSPRAQLLPCPGVGRGAATIAWRLLTCSLIRIITALRADVLECVLCAGRWAEHVPCTVMQSPAVSNAETIGAEMFTALPLRRTLLPPGAHLVLVTVISAVLG